MSCCVKRFPPLLSTVVQTTVSVVHSRESSTPDADCQKNKVILLDGPYIHQLKQN